jgi:hypothetical protein
VKRVVGHTWVNDELEYLVEWEGYDDLSYEPEEMFDCPVRVAEYWKEVGRRRGLEEGGEERSG